MQKRNRVILTIVVLAMLVLTSTVSAQYSGYSWTTAYQVVNMGAAPADVTVEYYDSSGNIVTGATKYYQDIPVGGSQLVVQFIDDTGLGDGMYSAVISSDQPVAAIVNQQLIPVGATSYNPKPPFSTYSGESSGSTTITLPAVMYNWYNYYTEIFVQNVGSGDASNVDIAYIPGSMNGTPTGASGVADNDLAIPQFASIANSQQNKSALGAPSGTYAGRFLGSATITSDQPIIAVVNQHNVSAYKLMTYNGTASGTTDIAVPNYMRGYWGYYSTLLVANPSTSQTAHVTLTYTPDVDKSVVSSGSIGPVTVTHDVAPQTALTRHDGLTATDAQSDLDDNPVYTRFFGSIAISSDIPVVAQVNVEAVQSGDDQAGSFNGIPVSSATQNIVVPVILADYYSYYTTLIVQNTTGTAGSCDVTYTSDGVYSAVKNHSATYTHSLPANGSFTVYEGRKGNLEIGDINHDPQWRSGGKQQFLGAASISCTVNAVAFVNEESDITQRDSMYTFNTFNK